MLDTRRFCRSCRSFAAHVTTGREYNAARFICFIYGDSTFIRLALFRVTRESTLSSAFYGGDLYARKRDDFERGDIRPRKIWWKIMPSLGHVAAAGKEKEGERKIQ